MLSRLAVASAALVAFFATGALADDRPLTEAEKPKLAAALAAEGCSGGEWEFDDDEYEVDDAKCSDGRTYDLEFDRAFKLIKKDRDD